MTEVKQKRRWMPVVLGLSLALNLAVVAAISGAAWRHKGGDGGGPRVSKGGGAVYMMALPREARKDLRAQMRGTGRGTSDINAMLEALRADPFDAAAAGRVLDAQRDRGLARHEAARKALLAKIGAMSAQERAVYADRIEEISQRRKDKWKKRREE